MENPDLNDQEDSQPYSTFYQRLKVPFDHPVTSLTIDPTGKEACMAARRGLYLIDLENPFQPPRIYQHVSKFDVTDIQWNVHVERREWIASTSNQKALIWNITRNSPESGLSNVQFVLKKHQRAISDLNWSPWATDLLATCSYDAYVYLWDLRLPTDTPSNSFCGWTAGAQQVKFNRINENILASSHDTDVRIWDIRKGSAPLKLITAHFSKICGIDWSRSDENELLTCGQDKLVKIWNIENGETCQESIETSTPCWRARYTPFGHGIVTMPQKKDSNLYLWNRNSPASPVYIFEGHEDVPTEFVWRKQNGNEFGLPFENQLITWSKDLHLRFWPVNAEVVNMVTDYSEDDFRSSSINPISITRFRGERPHSDSQIFRFSAESASLGELDSFSETGDNLNTDQLIENEIARIEAIPEVTVDRSLWAFRKCIFKLERVQLPGISIGASTNSRFQLQLEVVYPKSYPYTAPYFDIKNSYVVSMINKRLISRKLFQISNACLAKRQPSVEIGISYLLGIKSEKIASQNINTGSNSVEISGNFPGLVEQTSLLNISNQSSAGSYNEEKHPFTAVPRAGIEFDILSSSDASSSEDGADDELALGKNFSKAMPGPKDGNNVPFPRLCGATFSPTGLLCLFFSPIPHPSETKFTSFALSQKNQQPILQTQKFHIQPKTYPLYESYRNFVLSKCPRLLIRSTTRSTPGIHEDSLKNSDADNPNPIDYKLDAWFDEEDNEDETFPIPWRNNQHLGYEYSFSTDFLARLVNYSKRSGSGVSLSREKQKPFGNDILSPKHSMALSVVPPMESDPASLQSSSPPEAETVDPDIYVLDNVDDELSDKHGETHSIKASSHDEEMRIPFIGFQKAEQVTELQNLPRKVPFRPTGIKPRGSPTGTEDEPSLPIGTDKIELPVEIEDKESYGTFVYVMDTIGLLPINSKLASRYVDSGSSKVAVCEQNAEIVKEYGSYNIFQLWRFISLQLKICSSGQPASWKIDVFDEVLRYLDSIGDYQTISVMVGILLSTEMPNTEENTRPQNVIPTNNHQVSDPKSRLARSLAKSDKFPSYEILLQKIKRSKKANVATPIIIKFDYRQHVIQYTDYLYNLELLTKRTKLLNSVVLAEYVNTTVLVKFEPITYRCSCNFGPIKCADCCMKEGRCGYCRLLIKGLFGFCPECNHGGHLKCMKEWCDLGGTECLYGCGCKCK